ncbi:MAG: creatininase family protein [Planctomycetota bacterium]|nr:creatininase family protein [Planctomycetota bacterium]MDA1252266.1 creatininase family protein [Planctomycetota bacterium]
MPPRRFMLLEANYRQLLDDPPSVAILPWGATEAHNYHLPHGTDVIEASCLAEGAARLAVDRGAKPIVLPAIPFGNNEQQLDQVATISFTTATAGAILSDVVRSLKTQEIDRLLILNGHGGNEFKPLVRDVQNQSGSLVVVANFFQIRPDALDEIFDDPGDHAGELETSLLLHLCPDLVEMDRAGDGSRVPFTVAGLGQPGVWTPRPWSQSHPDTGCGNPSAATADKGRRYFEASCEALAEVIVGLSAAQRGDLPYV